MDTQDGRWPRLWEIFHEALGKPAQGRDGFLENACAGDLELRRELNELLPAHENSGGGFLSGDAAGRSLADPAERAIGTRLGRYRVRSVISGEVWGSFITRSLRKGEEALSPEGQMKEKPLRKESRFDKMNAHQLAEATALYDREMVIEEFKPPSAAVRGRWERARRKRGRPQRGKGAK